MLSSSWASLVTAFALFLSLGACSGMGVEHRAMPAEWKEAAVAAAMALDDAWGRAAVEGDIDGALDCFAAGEGFSFAYDGGLITSFDDFIDLVRRSYVGRAMKVESLARRVAAVAPAVAVLSGRSRATVTAADGSTSTADYVYGFVCTEEAGAWKIVQAHEFSVQ